MTCYVIINPYCKEQALSCNSSLLNERATLSGFPGMYTIIMVEPECEQFGITKEQCDSLYARKDKVRNYTFGIASALGILAGCTYGIYQSHGVYETVLFVLFFGGFLGSLFGAVVTITVKVLYVLLLYIFSPVYRNCRQYRAARDREEDVLSKDSIEEA